MPEYLTPQLAYLGGLSAEDKRLFQESLNQGNRGDDIINWMKARDAAGPTAWNQQARSEAWEADPDKYGRASSLIRYLDKDYTGPGYNESWQPDDWVEGGSWTDGVERQPSQTAREHYLEGQNAVLKQARYFDPNASLNEDGNLQMDRSKLPAFAAGNQNAKYANNGLTSMWTNGASGRVIDPNKVIHDSNYGSFTGANNLTQASNDGDSGFMGQLGKYAPAAITAIMSAGMGAAGGPLLGGLMSAGLGPGGVMNKLSMGEDIDWKKTGINAATAAAGSMIPGLGAASGMDTSTLADIMKYFKYAKQGYSLYNHFNNGRG